MTIVEIKLLDHGYLKFIEHWGSDERIVEAARMSTDKGFLGWGGDECLACRAGGRLDNHGLFHTIEDALSAKESCSCKGSGKTVGDEKLLAYLYDNRHATPFEMAGLTIVVQAPIFVFREWHRHRTQSYNELSARYTPLPDINYIPTVERLMLNAGDLKNKQAGTIKDAEVLTVEKAVGFQGCLKRMYESQEMLYQDALHMGVPKELARVHLPGGRYSRMMASANLRNCLAFLTLRMDSKAQWEIRQYANALGTLIAERFPRTWALFARGMAK